MMARANWADTNRRKSILLLAQVILISCLLAGCFCEPTAGANEPASQESQSSSKTKGSKLQARISLESKSFDLVDDDETVEQKLASGIRGKPLGQSQERNTTLGATSANITGTKGRRLPEKSGRRLSNIWSMFLPDSSSDSGDYESGAAAAESGPEEETESVIGDERWTSGGPPAGNMTKSASEDATNERLVAKLARPVANSGQEKSMPVGAGAASNQNATTADGDSPVRLITGSLSQGERVATPNTNDIVSTIMGNLRPSNALSSATTNGTTGSALLERESESTQTSADGSQSEPDKTSTASNDGDQFERWLSRIKSTQLASVSSGAGGFREPAATTDSLQGSRAQSQAGGTELSKQLRASAAWHLRTSTSARTQSLPESQGATGASKQTKWAHNATSSAQSDSRSAPPATNTKGQTTASAIKGLPKRATQQQQQLLDSYKLRLQSHPFQQQMRQQQTQLIHGIKYPAGQASTISLSTTEGASNTSLAFGSHYIPQLNPIGSNQAMETSQVVNSSAATVATNQRQPTLANHNIANSSDSSSSSSAAAENEQNLAQQQQQRNIYQSQDEILRQVTSAINFEQQQLMMSQQQGDSPKREPAEPRPQSPTSGGGDNFMTPDGASRFLSGASRGANNASESGSSPNLAPLGNTLGAAAINSSSALSESPESLDIDKSFELLAERVRQLTNQQQNLQREQQQLLSVAQATTSNATSSVGQQPSWLRPALVQQAIGASGADNLSSLLAGLNKNQPDRAVASLEHIRELLQRHERTRNELKSSQESMMRLMKQMMQLKAAAAAAAASDAQQDPQRANTSGRLPSAWTHDGSPMPPPAPQSLSSSSSSSTQSNHDDQRPLQQSEIASGQRYEHAARLPPPDASNIGWMPLDGQAGARPHQHRQPAPVSPANLIKGRVRFPHHHQQQQQQQQLLQVDNVGLMLAPPNIEELHDNELLDQRVIGLPIALLNNDGEVELSHSQLEEAARAAVEQLGPARTQFQPNLEQQLHSSSRGALQLALEPKQRGSSKFVPRVAPNQAAQSRQQQADQLNQAHRLAQANSPQTFPAHNSRVPTTNSNRDFHNELQQHQQNLMRIDKLVSLLSPEQRNQLALSGSLLSSEPPSSNSTASQLEQIANALSARPEVELPAAVNQNRLKKEESQASRQESNNQKADEKIRGSGALEQAVASLGSQQQERRQQQQQQQQQQYNNIESNLAPNVPPMVGLYGQFARPGAESNMHGFGPLLGLQAYAPPPPPPPSRGLSVAANEGPAPLVTTTTVSGVGGPPMRLREISLYRPFGFRGHHALTYQASPAVAAMFPRLVAQPPTSGQRQQQQQMLDFAGDRLIRTGRPSILRHMTPIRATINEGQRIISQMVPHQPANHYQHQYPTHTSLGTLPFTSMRQHHILSHPLRRSHSPSGTRASGGAGGGGVAAVDHWRRFEASRSGANGAGTTRAFDLVSPSRPRVRHMDPTDGELFDYHLANEDERQLVQEGDGLMFATQLEQTISEEDAPNVGHMEQWRSRHQADQMKKSRPGRQMQLDTVLQQQLGRSRGHQSANSQVDKPAAMLPITQPCIPIGLNHIAPATSTTTPPSTSTQTASSVVMPHDTTSVGSYNRTSTNSPDIMMGLLDSNTTTTMATTK